MKKIFVVNWGEIVICVMWMVKKMGIKIVVIFLEVDRNVFYVCYVDEVVCVGLLFLVEFYLLGFKIIFEVKKLGVDGIYFGYGFLSENVEFVEEVENNNIIFIGLGFKVIRIMGFKLVVKEVVKKYDIFMVLGIDKVIIDIE